MQIEIETAPGKIQEPPITLRAKCVGVKLKILIIFTKLLHTLLYIGEKMNYCYIIKCADNSLYTGWTNNISKRFEAHCSGKGAKYTKGRGPLELVVVEEFETKQLAMKREYEIKHMSKKDKEKLVLNWQLNNVGLIDSYIGNKL